MEWLGLFGSEGPIRVNKIDLCLIKLLQRLGNFKLVVNDMLIPENNSLPLYNNLLGGPASCKDAP
jgi:hypothetical protein